MLSNNIDLVNEFISGCSDFWNEDKTNIDNKHKNILNHFESKYYNNIENFTKKIIDWEKHGDGNAPFQITLYHLKRYKFKKLLILILKEIKNTITFKRFDNDSFFDDIEIIKKTKGFDLLKEFPAHKNNLRNSFYFLDRDTSANYRWLRYIYISNQIIKRNLIKNNSSWIDIGSYYGGIQSIIKSKFPKAKMFLVDFNHQLCRSYVYLKNMYPNVQHIFPNDFHSMSNFKKIPEGAIIYVKIDDFNKLNNIKADLVTNFFSFGEMKRQAFNKYYNSEVINNSPYLYLINRFVSAPFFEPTYNTDLNIFDYLKNNFSKTYFDIFPIHHYDKIPRKIFNRFAKRPKSSPYFEMILKNKLQT